MRAQILFCMLILPGIFGEGDERIPPLQHGFNPDLWTLEEIRQWYDENVIIHQPTSPETDFVPQLTGQIGNDVVNQVNSSPYMFRFINPTFVEDGQTIHVHKNITFKIAFKDYTYTYEYISSSSNHLNLLSNNLGNKEDDATQGVSFVFIVQPGYSSLDLIEVKFMRGSENQLLAEKEISVMLEVR